MNEERIHYLLQQYAANKATKPEVEEMFSILQRAKNDGILKRYILQTIKTEDEEQGVSVEGWNRMWEAVASSAFRKQATRVIPMAWLRVAAACLLLATGIAIFFLYKPKNNAESQLAKGKRTLQNDVPPGGNRAMLTLANGSVIVLDSAHNGSLAQQGNTSIVKLDAGALSYSTGDRSGQVFYNIITTPRGGQYQVTLADGTVVWLNAASSLRFPTVFSGNERDVELTGEAYFEVAKNAAMPFHVKVNKMDVQVLGTHFNIMAYNNEQAIKTTLLEGRVRVTANGATKNITPGEQAVFANNGDMEVRTVNTDYAVAWKNGLFRFKETNIRELMRQVERWYDVDVVYETQGKYQDYTGIVSRSENVSVLLQMLELTGTVRFKVEGRKITVLPS